MLVPQRTHVQKLIEFLQAKVGFIPIYFYCFFMDYQRASYKVINKDQWIGILDFTAVVDTDFFPYDPDMGECAILTIN